MVEVGPRMSGRAVGVNSFTAPIDATHQNAYSKGRGLFSIRD